jgi:hypothetical protein
MAFTLNYVLGVKSPAGKAALLGTATHKALELLARRKLAHQAGKGDFHDEETGQTFTQDLTVEQAVDTAYTHYSTAEPHVAWAWADRNTILKLANDALDYREGMFSPLKRDILTVEDFFEIEIDQPWAAYDYTLPNGQCVKGQLGLKGTIDLVYQVDENTIECVDWKTGRYRTDWATGEEKDWKKLREDPQLRIYHYALAKKYPGKCILMTIVFIRAGGAFSLPFGVDDLDATETMLKKRFEEIRHCQRPRLNISWQCTKFCHYGKTGYENTGKTICAHYNDELQQLGLKGVMKRYGQNSFDYGDGGGQSNRAGAGVPGEIAQGTGNVPGLSAAGPGQ